MANCLQSWTTPRHVDDVSSARLNGREVLVQAMYEHVSGAERCGGVLIHEQTADGFVPWVELLTDFGILEAKVSDDVLITVTSDSTVLSYSIGSDGELQLQRSASIEEYHSPDTIGVALDVCHERIASCSSAGTVVVLDGSSWEVRHRWQAHEAETWCVTFNKDGLLATGADDRELRIWDTRDLQRPAASNAKSHDAGVTVAQWADENRLYTGSYDGHLRLFDTRQLARPVAEVQSLDGIWRIRPQGQSLLVACTWSGLQKFSGELSEEASWFTDQKDRLWYGVASSRDGYAACSFYDNSVITWN
ncbi:MAG: hypothetical protein KVP17_001159 [Porospora cf. gigantea B]|uniref:uncharacterized protein n=1 Tax=Porospora cf. gigantea B TaxID=2853592 RepID=UPI0035719409|nr:MAG: hypothetical protein KVP17_001159 [Porospora cf. gigantea B]